MVYRVGSAHLQAGKLTLRRILARFWIPPSTLSSWRDHTWSNRRYATKQRKPRPTRRHDKIADDREPIRDAARAAQ
jgi:hypothetical protein